MSDGRLVGVIAAAPNGTWQTAQPFEFGQTIYGRLSDERPYAPSPTEDAYAAMLKGFQWFRFRFPGNEPRLVYFELTTTDRDVPLDIDIFTLGKNGTGSRMWFRTGKESLSTASRQHRIIPAYTNFALAS